MAAHQHPFNADTPLSLLPVEAPQYSTGVAVMLLQYPHGLTDLFCASCGIALAACSTPLRMTTVPATHPLHSVWFPRQAHSIIGGTGCAELKDC